MEIDICVKIGLEKGKITSNWLCVYLFASFKNLLDCIVAAVALAF